MKAADIALEHHMVGTKHVFTSPDVPELYIAHADKEVARASVQSALDVLEGMKERLKAREAIRGRAERRLIAV